MSEGVIHNFLFKTRHLFGVTASYGERTISLPISLSCFLQVSSYLTGDSSTPLVIHGPSGSGKTSIMAKAIANAVASVMYTELYYDF